MAAKDVDLSVPLWYSCDHRVDLGDENGSAIKLDPACCAEFDPLGHFAVEPKEERFCHD